MIAAPLTLPDPCRVGVTGSVIPVDIAAAKAVGRIAAGDTPTGSFAGAVRILSGATVPQGFDAVVMQQKCRVEGDVVIIDERPRAGLNFRHAGEECAGESACSTPVT